MCHHLPKNNSNIHFCGWSIWITFIDILVCKHYGEEPCVREITTNYVTLTIPSWHSYSIWDFTLTWIPNNLLLTCESLPLYGLWPNPTSSSITYELFPSLAHFPWAFCTPSFMGSTCQPHMFIHRNQLHSYPLELRA